MEAFFCLHGFIAVAQLKLSKKTWSKLGLTRLHGFIAVAQLKHYPDLANAEPWTRLHGFIAVAQLKPTRRVVILHSPHQSPRLHRRGPIEAPIVGFAR